MAVTTVILLVIVECSTLAGCDSVAEYPEKVIAAAWTLAVSYGPSGVRP